VSLAAVAPSAFGGRPTGRAVLPSGTRDRGTRRAPAAPIDSPTVAPAQSLYRRHRPQAFDQVVGQEHVVRTLSNAIERDRVHHAYLFVGSRGTGKTSIAKILARSLNCVNGPTLHPCGECESCRAIAAGTSMDVIEMDAASNRSVDDIRELRERVGFAPTGGKWKVYILDEAHMLTREAWNAFLKTLEEPPPNTVFVLATTEAHKVMPTIVDRCQRFDFQRPTPEQIAEVVRRVAQAESIEIADGAIAALARGASGSFRDALGTLDQLVSYGGKRIETEDVLTVLGVADSDLLLAAADAIAAGDARATLEVTERLARSGRDPAQFGRDLLAHLRQLLVIRAVGEDVGERGLAAADPERMRSQAEAFSDLGLSRAIDAIAAALSAIREGDEPRMTLELALLRAARPQLDPSREAFAQRLERLEAALAGGAPPAAPADGGAGEKPQAPPAAGPAHEPPRQAATAQPAAAAPPRAEEAPRAAAPSTRRSPEPEPEPAPGGERGAEAEASAPESAAPEAAAEAQAATAVAELPDLEGLVSLWPAILDQVREGGSELLAHALSASRPVGIDAAQGVIEIGFPPGASFNKRKAESPEARERIAAAVRAVVGARLKPVCAILDGEDVPGDDPVQAGPMDEEEIIARLKAEFDAEEILDEDSEQNEEEA